MIRKLLIITASAFLTGSVSAQTIETFKSQLSQRGASGASVKVTEYGDAAQIIRSFNPGDPDRIVTGHRVVIFVDNSNNARQTGDAVLSRFKELFPDIPAQMNYKNNPDFKVTVGNCLTSEEAMILWGRIKNIFEKAYRTREEIPLSSFGR